MFPFQFVLQAPAIGPGTRSIPAGDILVWVLVNIALILLAARLVGGLFARFNQPRVVGEIVAGILLGPSLLGLSLAGELWGQQPLLVIQRLGDIALLFFMFLVGMELDFKLLRGREKQIALVALAVVLGPVALGFAIAPTPFLNTPAFRPEGVSMAAYAMFVGAGLSVTAFPVMAHMLREKRLLGTEMGAIGVGAAAAITVLMFIAVAAAAAIGRGQGVATFKLAGPPYSPLQAAVLTVAFIAALVFLVRPLLARFAQTLDPERGVSAEFLAVTFLGVFLCGAIGDRIGITQWVGSFLFGTVMPLRPGVRRTIIDQLDGIATILLVPIFLAFSGIRTNLRLLTWELVPGILLFLVTMILAKVIIGTLASRAVGLQWRQSAVLGVLLNCRGLLVLAVALIGLQLNVITPQMQLIFVMGAIVTTLMTGPLFDILYRPTTERPPAERDAAPLTPRPAAGRPSAASAPGRARADRER